MELEITSPYHPLIKKFVSLSTAKGREKNKLYLAYGMRVCSTIIEYGVDPYYILISDKTFLKKHPFDKINNQKIIIVPDYLLDKIDPSKNSSGIVGIFPIPSSGDPEELDATLVLAQINDPGNMGTLFRTCAALNKKNIVCVQGVDPWNPKVVQASAGTCAKLVIFNWSWQELLAYKKSKKLYALVISNGTSPLNIDFQNSLLIVGNEAHGIPEEWITNCDGLITIPMPGNTESLNAAVAGSLALYLVNKNILFSNK